MTSKALSTSPIANGDTIAAVDLGSNSFHLLIARVVDGHLITVDRLRERTALAAGLESDGNLMESTRERALSALRKFGERIGTLPSTNVRAVGTNTFRQISSKTAFLNEAEHTLGHPIDIISGREEARLIFAGVVHELQGEDVRRLVVDIGGGSTECILGEGQSALVADSLHMGCVSFSRSYFPGGQITAERFDRAVIAASLELQSIDSRYRATGWYEAIGSSGTAVAIASILRAQGLSDAGITRKGLRKLRKAIIAAGATEALNLEGMQPDRASVLPGGLAILMAVFDRFSLEHMQVSQSALRQGLVFDLAGEAKRVGRRAKTVETLMERFKVDQEQAKRVEHVALDLHRQCGESWSIASAYARGLLSNAAKLHETGQALSYSGYHKHSAYLVQYSDMPGFSRNEQEELALLLRSHRRQLRLERLSALSNGRLQMTLKLCLLLRIAVKLCRNRSDSDKAQCGIRVKKKTVELSFSGDWLKEHPLTQAGLEEENAQIAGTGYSLTIA